MNPIAHSPHAHAPVSIGKVMGTVLLALTPATLFGFWLYGWPAINLWAVSLIAAIVGEAFAVHLQGRAVRPALMDGSGILTAWLLAISLPPFAPWWIAVLGSLFAVIIGKQVFGGLGQNPFNPAMAARVMLLISFPLEMTTWVAPCTAGFGASARFAGKPAHHVHEPASGWHGQRFVAGSREDRVHARLGLDQALAGYYAPFDALWGSRAGSLGETAAVLILIGGLFLIARRIITWHAPVAMLLGVAVPALIFNISMPIIMPDRCITCCRAV